LGVRDSGIFFTTGESFLRPYFWIQKLFIATLSELERFRETAEKEFGRKKTQKAQKGDGFPMVGKRCG
jgi:hypothetical protein